MTRRVRQPIELPDKPFDLRCHRCKRLLATKLRRFAQVDRVCLDDGEQLLPKGVAAIRTDMHRIHGWGEPDDHCIVVGRPELTNVLDAGGQFGCCGPTGEDGPNLKCECGVKLGTYFGDCCMPHSVELDGDRVEVCLPEWGLPR